MNTKTMRLPPRRVLTPSTSTNKRKERDDPFERPAPVTIPIPVPLPAPGPGPTPKLPKPDKPITPRLGAEPIQVTAAATTSKVSVSEPMMTMPPPSNQLLAGYLAHEYLTKGTLLGQPWVPTKTDGPTKADDGEEGRKAAAEEEEEERERYAEVAGLLRGGGTHLPGVVNPTQLARFLHL